MLKFLKTTLVGGVVFLVPVVIFIVLMGKALGIAQQLVDPLAKHLPIETIGGLRMARILSVVLVVLVCFVGGLVARTGLASKLVTSLEGSVLSRVPGYALVKSICLDLLGVEEQQMFPPVLVRFDDAWQIGFQVEVLDDGMVTVFLPDVPNPQSGSIFFVTADRVRPAGISFAAAMKGLKRAGVGFRHQLPGLTMKP